MRALIAAGGRGTRLRPITTTQNKHEIPLANKSMLEHALNKVIQAGITDIIVSINAGDTELPRLGGDGKDRGVHITYIEQQGGALGVAHVIKNAASYLVGDDFVFYLGDNIILGDIKPFVEQFYRENLQCLLALSRVSDPQRFGVPRLDNEGNILEIIEKPDNPPSPYAVAGIYIYSDSILNIVDQLQPSDRGEYEISDVHTQLIHEGYKVGYAEITGWWKDTGKPKDLLEGNGLILGSLERCIDGQVEDSVELEGIVVIESGAKITGRSFLRGPVIIGHDTIIESAYIGPYTSIGDQCTIRNAEIEHSLVMDRVEIDVHNRVVDSILGHEVRVFSKEHSFPRGHQLILGDNSLIEL